MSKLFKLYITVVIILMNKINDMKKLFLSFSFKQFLKYKKYNPLFLLLFLCNSSNAQKFSIGDELNPTVSEFQLLGISSSTGVYSYKYKKTITAKMFDRQIGDIIVGIKKGHVVTTIYNLIPEPNDIDVPYSIIKFVENLLPYPLAYNNGVYGVNIDNTSITLSRTSNTMTFGKDRIMYFSSIKQSLLTN